MKRWSDLFRTAFIYIFLYLLTQHLFILFNYTLQFHNQIHAIGTHVLDNMYEWQCSIQCNEIGKSWIATASNSNLKYATPKNREHLTAEFKFVNKCTATILLFDTHKKNRMLFLSFKRRRRERARSMHSSNENKFTNSALREWH